MMGGTQLLSSGGCAAFKGLKALEDQKLGNMSVKAKSFVYMHYKVILMDRIQQFCF